MTTLMQANQQWSSRPADERFLSLTALHESVTQSRARSASRTISSRKLQALPVDGDHKALVVAGPNGKPATLSNWSFGQLAARAGAPAGYLRGLPSEMAADCLNFGLQVSRDIEDVGILLDNGDQALAIRVPLVFALVGLGLGFIEPLTHPP